MDVRQQLSKVNTAPVVEVVQESEVGLSFGLPVLDWNSDVVPGQCEQPPDQSHTSGCLLCQYPEICTRAGKCCWCSLIDVIKFYQ